MLSRGGGTCVEICHQIIQMISNDACESISSMAQKISTPFRFESGLLPNEIVCALQVRTEYIYSNNGT